MQEQRGPLNSSDRTIAKGIQRPELLAPAGDFEKLKTAIHYGADSVYLGDQKFSLRNKARNFGDDELAAALQYAHEHSVKVYITANIFARNSDLPGMRAHITLLREIKPDAVIVSDPGVFMMLRETAPELDVHVSTQANITNIESALFWQKMGAKRLILSRELSIDEIAEISKGTDIELEAFVHGSVCLSYSGKCYLSSFMASRSANSGECTNSCRWKYSLVEEKRPGQFFPVFEDDRGSYVMNSRDLCLIEHLPLLRRAGVSSFKIEGRMKSMYYVGCVTKVYREALDLLDEEESYRQHLPLWQKELAQFGNRGYTEGLLFGRNRQDICNTSGDAPAVQSELAGIVVDVQGKIAKVILKGKLSVGDAIEYLTPGLETKAMKVRSLRYEDGIEAVSAKYGETVLITASANIRKGDLIRKYQKHEGVQ